AELLSQPPQPHLEPGRGGAFLPRSADPAFSATPLAARRVVLALLVPVHRSGCFAGGTHHSAPDPGARWRVLRKDNVDPLPAHPYACRQSVLWCLPGLPALLPAGLPGLGAEVPAGAFVRGGGPPAAARPP